MAHECTDWTASPPTRKLPLLVLTRGDDRVYSIVPKDFKTLEEIAREEFDLGDANIKIFSSCVSHCSRLPARITERSWEFMSPYIGCATVKVFGSKTVQRHSASREERPTASVSKNTGDEGDSGTEEKLSSSADKGDENDGIVNKPRTYTGEEVVRHEQGTLSDHGNDQEGASALEGRPGEPWEEEEVSAILPRRQRNPRRITSEDEDEHEESEREREALARSQVPPIASPPRPTQSKVKQGRVDDSQSQSNSQSAEPLHQPSKLIKQEKTESGRGSRPFPKDDVEPSHTESQYEIQTQVQAESSENYKVMIRVAHRPSKQESKFTTKNTTKVAKVLGAACKSFGLEPGGATLYLIVPTEDEDGEVENLFPCDKGDTIARAGAELNTESKFLLKMAGES